jgi:beta-glucuronidase
MDVISFNRYFGWYDDPGRTVGIENALSAEIEERFNLHHKPILVTEYGAGAIAGFHKVISRIGLVIVVGLQC